MNSNIPKSMILIGEKPLLYYNVKSVIQTGIKSIIIVIDDLKYEAIIIQHLDLFSNIKIVYTERKTSTFIVLKHCLDICNEWILFLYGHAPRPTHYLNTIISSEKLVVASSNQNSTKRNKILLELKYLEPPYLLRKDTIKYIYNNWQDFFDGNADCTEILKLDGPPEFNYTDEYLEYNRYVYNNLLDIQK